MVTLPGQAPWGFEHAYSDHIRVAPAAGDAVLVREAGSGAPVVVSGAWGKGTVVLSGILLGSGSGASASPEEARLLTALVRP